MSGAEFILRKLLFGQRAEVRPATPAPAERGAAAPAADALPRGVSGGEDFNPHDSET